MTNEIYHNLTLSQTNGTQTNGTQGDMIVSDIRYGNAVAVSTVSVNGSGFGGAIQVH